jgi:hypothetical protein
MKKCESSFVPMHSKHLLPEDILPIHLLLLNPETSNASFSYLLKQQPSLRAFMAPTVLDEQGKHLIHYIRNPQLISEFDPSLHKLDYKGSTLFHLLYQHDLIPSWHSMREIDLSSVIDMQDAQGNTLLHLAAYRLKHDHIIGMLMKYQASKPNLAAIQNNDGNTFSHILLQRTMKFKKSIRVTIETLIRLKRHFNPPICTLHVVNKEGKNGEEIVKEHPWLLQVVRQIMKNPTAKLKVRKLIVYGDFY